MRDLSRIEAGREELHLADFDPPAVVQTLDGMLELHCEQTNPNWKVDADLPPQWVHGARKETAPGTSIGTPSPVGQNRVFCVGKARMGRS